MPLLVCLFPVSACVCLPACWSVCLLSACLFLCLCISVHLLAKGEQPKLTLCMLMWQGGLRPHAFCLPILKREEHRQAVLAAATSNCTRFFLGTDSAPHPKHLKVSNRAKSRVPAFKSVCACKGLCCMVCLSMLSDCVSVLEMLKSLF